MAARKKLRQALGGTMIRRMCISEGQKHLRRVDKTLKINKALAANVVKA